MEGSGRRGLLISRGWVQAVVLVVLFGFFVLGLLAYRTYSGQPPIPHRVVDPAGEVVFTAEDVRAGQGVFLRNGLMEYGSNFGHGAYLGPDFTADYLHPSALFVRERYGGEGSDRATVQTVSDFKENRYDPETRTLEFTAPQAAAFEELRGHYGRYFGEPTTRYGLRPEAISDPEEIRQLTAYFAWTAWAASALRPGTDYTYTNNWPPEPLVENEPTANVVVWSVLSLIALLGGIGLLFAAFGRWNFLGWRGREQATLSFRTPGDVALTPAQRACAWFFLVMAALFLIQTMVGAASQHYRADLASFFGVDLAQWFPYNLMRTWHVQLAIFWVATSFLAAGIFFAPMVAGREPRGQHLLAFGLLGALAAVVFGSMIGEYAGIFGFLINLPIISYYQIGTMDHWPHSEAGRIHRGISLAVVLIAGLILAVAAIRNHAPLEIAILGAMLAVVALAAWHLHAAFRATPANFPVPQAVTPTARPLRVGYRKGRGARR